MITKQETKTGMNFTVYEMDTREEYDQFLKDHADLFRFVGYSGGLQENGKYKIVY